MSHFAQIDDFNTVVQVIVADQSFIDSGSVGNPAQWIRTSYNGNIRARFAGIGYSYDPDRDAFIPPKQFPSWSLDEETLDWTAPLPRPSEGEWIWNERELQWHSV
jgi:hypothetical protein